MIHVFKAGGDWATKDGTSYTVKAIESKLKSEYLADGWVSSLEEVKAEVEITGVDGGDYEREVRDKIKALGGKAGGRASVETLELKLAELEAKSEIGIE